MKDISLLYIDLFCGAGGTSTGVENARINIMSKFRVLGTDSNEFLASIVEWEE